MNDIYNMKEDGDDLEREYIDFIQMYFKTYEDVWKLYIGNKGNNTKGDIPGYTSDRDEKRQKFSEHTYTILQSVILLYRLVNNDSFTKSNFNTLSERLDLQDNLLLFFTHLGRIRDNVEDASSCLLNVNTKETTAILDEFYHKRHILVHGKAIPILFKTSGEILLPVLSKNGTDITGWNHKAHNWEDISSMSTETLVQTVTQLYWELLPRIAQIFGEFKIKIEDELNSKSYKLSYDRTQTKANSFESGSSGYSGYSGVDVYGIANKNPYKL